MCKTENIFIIPCLLSSVQKLRDGQIGTALKMTTARMNQLPTVTLCLKLSVSSDEELKNVVSQANVSSKPFFLESAAVPLDFKMEQNVTK